MKQLINRRSSIFFAVSVAALIAITSFLHGYSNGETGLLNPMLMVFMSAVIAFAVEGILQSRRR